MKKTLLALALVAAMAASATDYPIIPAPASYQATEGTYTLPEQITIAANAGLDSDRVKAIREALEMRGFNLSDAKAPAAKGKKTPTADFVFTLNQSIPAEGYVLEITPSQVNVEASSDAGFFYAVQTLDQLRRNGMMKPCRIVDEPRYAYRSVMLDPSRWFIPKEEVLKIIDMAAAMKMNNLHIHLSDDNGWRMEIKKYPKLTEVGAWRVDRPEYFPGRMNPQPGEPTPIGGFYTQDDLREIVAYASDRHINVVPEIDVPAHSASAIAAYPELACPITDKFVGVFPGIGGPDASIILCAGNEDVYSFYQDVLDEIMDVFPSQYVHLGGDEAEKSHWEKCPLCNAKKEAEGLANYEELQGYFMDRLNKYVQSKGRKVICWDEVTHGFPKEECVIMGWNGYGNAAIEYAKKTGSKFILTPAKVMYLIRYQGPQWFEPFTYFGNATLKDVYEFEPVKADWSPELQKQLLGIQGSMWNEFIQSSEHLEYQLFPRLIAVADNAWRPYGQQDFPAFIEALDRFTPQLDERGITFARSMYNLDHKVTPDNGSLSVDLSCIRPDMEVRYSFDDPSLITFKPYSAPVAVTAPSKVYAATFADGRQQGQTLTLSLDFNAATGADVKSPNCNNDIVYVLTNGLRGSDRNSDFEWAGWHNRNAEFTIDLGEPTEISSATLGTLANSHICVAAPRSVTILGSIDGENFSEISSVELPDDVVWHKGAKIIDIDFGNLAAKARYLKFVARNPGRVPEGFARATAPTWLYFDEVIIN